MLEVSTRANVITRRTYNRPKEDGKFETFEETVQRVIQHQQWLWERQLKRVLIGNEIFELEQLKKLYLKRIASPSGRTMWLGGTEVAKKREATQFNCSFLKINTIHDVVDAYWLLLQGTGVGFKAITGVLNGFSSTVKEIKIEKRSAEERYIKSKNNDNNIETVINNGGEIVYILEIGDSAMAWAKSVGKLLALKQKIDYIVINTRRIRPAGERLRGYGWISSGSETLENALLNICNLLNNRVDTLLNEIDILDIMNHLGLTLSSRRSAEICLMDYENILSDEFATIKKDHWINNQQRSQSNNSLIFWKKPSKHELKKIFKLMEEWGGSEPGFINGQEAQKRALYFQGVNPCAEILLGDKSFCNLTTIDLNKCNEMTDDELEKVFHLVGRANYRQTCVNLKDEILQTSWNELNQFLRLTGLNITGFVTWKHQHDAEKLRLLRQWAVDGVNSMSDELCLPRSKNVTTVQPSGTLCKIMDTTEGAHKPLGKYIFNNVRFSKYDNLVDNLKKSNYYVFNDPYSSDAVLVRLPVKYEHVDFDKDENGKDVNKESAILQLNRYKMLMDNYVQHNCSITISYSSDEVPEIIEWFMKNWNSYVGVSFLYRNNASKTAKDLGYPYLPQEVVTKEDYDSYVSTLKEFKLDEEEKNEHFEINVGNTMCINGVCPEK
jgi:ribonucleoside-triphosphate reductase